MAHGQGRTGGLLLLIAGAGLACGGGGGGGDLSPDGSPGGPIHLTDAPLCSEVALSADPRELFEDPLVPPDDVRDVLPLGEMDPGALEPINFEQGFMLNKTAVELRAPATMYVRSFEVTEYIEGWRAGVVDYGLTFEICSMENEDGIRVPAVTGALAHVTGVAGVLAELEARDDLQCEVDDGNPDDVARKCTLFLPFGETESLIIPGSTVIGQGGGSGPDDVRPGLDFNLKDHRYEVPFANPERLGAAEGPGSWWRHATCVYEYFNAPTRTAYLSKVGPEDRRRQSADAPCGVLAVDEPGTLAGIWIPEELASLDIDEDNAEVLGNILVLADDFLLPDELMVVSTDATDVVSHNDQAVLVEAPVTPTEEADDINVRFSETVPGVTYCVEGGSHFFGDASFSLYVRLGQDDKLTIESLDEPCAEIAQGARTFSAGARTYVR